MKAENTAIQGYGVRGAGRLVKKKKKGLDLCVEMRLWLFIFWGNQAGKNM